MSIIESDHLQHARLHNPSIINLCSCSNQRSTRIGAQGSCSSLNDCRDIYIRGRPLDLPTCRFVLCSMRTVHRNQSLSKITTKLLQNPPSAGLSRSRSNGTIYCDMVLAECEDLHEVYLSMSPHPCPPEPLLLYMDTFSTLRRISKQHKLTCHISRVSSTYGPSTVRTFISASTITKHSAAEDEYATANTS